MRELTDGSATATDSYTYGAYGELLTADTGPTENNYRYTGEQLDPDLGASTAAAPAGLYYLRARYYNPGHGRFMARDPWGGSREDPITLHRYLYANGNPAMNIDPGGMFSLVGALLPIPQNGSTTGEALRSRA